MKINYGNLCQWILFSPILLPILFIGGLVNNFLYTIAIVKNDIIEPAIFV